MLTNFEPEHAPEISERLKLAADKVAEALRTSKRGKANAVKSYKIEIGMTLRGCEVRAIVRYLRQKLHYPICSCCDGYYWATSQADIDKSVAHLRERMNSLGRTIKEMETVKI